MLQNKRVYLVGSLLILLAVAIVLGSLLIPRAVQKKDMKDFLQGMLEKADMVAITAPLYETQDVLGNTGKDRVLDDAESRNMQQHLKALLECGFRVQGKQIAVNGAFEMHLIVRTPNATYKLYVTEKGFYRIDGTKTTAFLSKDADVYAAFYDEICVLIAE